MNRRVLIFTALLGLVVAYLGLRLAEGVGHWAFLGVLALLLWLLPVLYWSSEADEFSAWELRGQQASFICMGLLSWVLVLAVARDLALLLLRLTASPAALEAFRARTQGTPAFVLALALTAWGAWRALRGPRLREVTVKVDGLPAALSGLRIAQISDLHVGPSIGRDYVERLVGKVREARPDLTTLTGDIVDGNLADLRDAVAPLAGLEPAGKVFYVPGNHEYYWTIEPWLAELSRLGAEPLLNRGTAIEREGARIWIGGITDPAAKQAGAETPDVGRAFAGSGDAAFRLLLSHRPDAAEQAARAGFQLQLSGHTHGGQFFPWTHVGRLFHRFYLGLMRHEGMWIYVSPGTGTWGPPVRLGTTPELTLLTIERA